MQAWFRVILKLLEKVGLSRKPKSLTWSAHDMSPKVEVSDKEALWAALDVTDDREASGPPLA